MRNRKKEYIKKLLGIETKNGYKIDINNYLFNPSLEHEYPSLKKVIEETPETIKTSEVIFFKYYGGAAEYLHKIYTFRNSGDTWEIATNVEKKILKEATRFNLHELIRLAETI